MTALEPFTHTRLSTSFPTGVSALCYPSETTLSKRILQGMIAKSSISSIVLSRSLRGAIIGIVFVGRPTTCNTWKTPRLANRFAPLVATVWAPGEISTTWSTMPTHSMLFYPPFVLFSLLSHLVNECVVLWWGFQQGILDFSDRIRISGWRFFCPAVFFNRASCA